MLITILCCLLLVSGGAVMAAATVKYHSLLAYYRQEIYEELGRGYYVNLSLLYIFVFGFIIAAVDAFLRNAALYHLFVSLAVLLASVYVLFSVRAQARTAALLREKVLEAIRAFVYTIDTKDHAFKNHSKHVYDIVSLFYEALPEYRCILNREKLLDAAILHDIGKINISQELLTKRERLSTEEWEQIKTHARQGRDMLNETSFREIGDWVMYHHERVDGNGYYGLLSEDIPLESKIIAIADSYSALCSDRAWRKRKSHEESIAVITAEAGGQFDPRLVECFLRIDRAALIKATERARVPEGIAGDYSRQD
ncbi:MAG: HD domain-containing protein [Treponema sp.]|jgi:HD-GYP domain-containing protein (c-di-GMP phosphodiesterase class II)|nr:HD domain-containing protein [Treponema sp.]